jgi:hypothetical protein
MPLLLLTVTAVIVVCLVLARRGACAPTWRPDGDGRCGD